MGDTPREIPALHLLLRDDSNADFETRFGDDVLKGKLEKFFARIRRWEGEVADGTRVAALAIDDDAVQHGGYFRHRRIKVCARAPFLFLF